MNLYRVRAMQLSLCTLVVLLSVSGSSAGQVEFGWMKFCLDGGLGSACRTEFRSWDSATGAPIITIWVSTAYPGKSSGLNGPQPSIVINVPEGIRRDRGWELYVDGSKVPGWSAEFFNGKWHCENGKWCQGTIHGGVESAIEAMRSGRNARVEVTSFDGDLISFPIPLEGFRDWFDSAGGTESEYRVLRTRAEANAGFSRWAEKYCVIVIYTPVETGTDKDGHPIYQIDKEGEIVHTTKFEIDCGW